MGSKTYRIQYPFINKSRGVGGGKQGVHLPLSKKFGLWHTNWGHCMVGLYIEYFRVVIMMTFFSSFLCLFNYFSLATSQCPLKKDGCPTLLNEKG